MDGLIPYIAMSMVSIEQAIKRTIRLGTGTALIPMLAIPGGRTATATVVLRGPNLASVMIDTVTMQLRIDSTGSILGGRIRNYVVERH